MFPQKVRIFPQDATRSPAKVRILPHSGETVLVVVPSLKVRIFPQKAFRSPSYGLTSPQKVRMFPHSGLLSPQKVRMLPHLGCTVPLSALIFLSTAVGAGAAVGVGVAVGAGVAVCALAYCGADKAIDAVKALANSRPVRKVAELILAPSLVAPA